MRALPESTASPHLSKNLLIHIFFINMVLGDLLAEANYCPSTIFPALCEHVSTVQINTGTRALPKIQVRHNLPREPVV